MNAKLVLLVVLSSLAVVFVAQNGTVVEIAFLFWTVSVSGALLIFFTLLLGFLVGWFLHDYIRYRKYKGRSVYIR